MAHDISRREVINTVALAGIGLSFPPMNPFFLKQDKSVVSVVKGNAALSLRKAVELLGGMNTFVKKDCRVVIKPNMGFTVPPSYGATTSPETVAETARLCVEAGAESVIVIDHPLRKPEICLKITGIKTACENIPRTHVFAVADEEQFSEIPVPKGISLKKTKILNDILKPRTVLINIAAAKSHGATTVSLCLKNLMGLIFERHTFHKNLDLNQAIADLATVTKCDLNIIDATRALVTGGPGGPGQVETLNTIVAGKDIVSVDAVGVTLTQWYGKRINPHEVRHIDLAEKLGLGPANLDKIEIIRG